MSSSYSSLLSSAVRRLKRSRVRSAESVAVLLASHCFGDAFRSARRCAVPGSAVERRAFEEAVEEVAVGLSPYYVVGKKAFWEAEFEVRRGVLVPRSDSEAVVQAVLDLPLDPHDATLRVAEHCCGSGAIVISVLRSCSWSGFAYDVQESCVRVALRNAERLLAEGRLVVQQHDVMSNVPLPHAPFDVLVVNPPYVESADVQEVCDVGGDPAIALDGGEDGLRFYRRLSGVGSALKPGGFLVLEVGAGQDVSVQRLLEDEREFSQYAIHRDLGGVRRALSFQRKT